MAEPFRRCNKREKFMPTNHGGVKPIGGKAGGKIGGKRA